ncbi:MAG: hypothetical protein GY841_08655 [FCB group bacterium]|nr:hypothetical protein [FCB group bacterium]
MANTTITKKFYVDDALTNPTSITVAVTRTDTGATVVSATAMTNATTGVYYHTFANPASNLTYAYTIVAVYSGATYTFTGQQGADTGLAVSLSDIKEHLRIDTTDEDDLITTYIQAATSYVEEQTRRRFLDTTETITLEEFTDKTRMRYSPVDSVTSIQYYDGDNSQQTYSSDNYGVITGDAGIIYRVDGASWPTLYNRPDAITITYVAGYGTASDVPAWAVQAIKLMVGHWYENREASAILTVRDIPLGADVLCDLNRVWEVV